MLDDSSGEAASAYVDDLKLRVSSPWATQPAAQQLGRAAEHNGVVYECGADGKSTVSIEGVPNDALPLVEQLMNGTIQSGTPSLASVNDDNAFLGVPDGLPPLRCDGSPQRCPCSANQAVRLRILKRISTNAAVALRVSVVRVFRSPWPLLARRYYLSRAASKLAYLLPFSIGV